MTDSGWFYIVRIKYRGLSYVSSEFRVYLESSFNLNLPGDVLQVLPHGWLFTNTKFIFFTYICGPRNA